MNSQKKVVMESPKRDTSYVQHKQHNLDTGSEGPAKRDYTRYKRLVRKKYRQTVSDPKHFQIKDFPLDVSCQNGIILMKEMNGKRRSIMSTITIFSKLTIRLAN